MEETRANLSLEPLEPSADQAEKANQENTDSFEVIDYVRELFLNSEEQKKREIKKLKLMRVCVALLSVVTLVVIASAAILVPTMLTTVTEANKALVTVQQIDIKAISTNIDALAVQATDTFESVGEAVTVLNALDMESLNATISELKTGVESFSKLDIETLNTAIENLNATVEPLARLFGKK